jgi:hypothetical protein
MIHILDIVMYFVFLILIWIIGPKEELEALITLFVSVIFTIVYFIVFFFFLNWVDIFKCFSNIHINFTL